jgi:small subunit ribosomal protein S4e
MAAKGNTRHIRRLASSRYMKIGRKRSKYVAKPMAGRHNGMANIALVTVLKEKIMQSTTRDVRYLLNKGSVEINGKAVREEKYPVGFGDLIHLKQSKETYKVVSGKNGTFDLEKAEESAGQLFKVVGKHSIRGGKLAVRIQDGRIFGCRESKINVNDSVLLGKKGIEKIIPMEKGRECYVMNGTHSSEKGKIMEIAKGTALRDATVKINGNNGEFETLLRNVMVIGE